MELGSPVTWTKLCNLFYAFFILMVLILVCISSTVIDKDSIFKSFRYNRLACSWFMIIHVK